MQEGANLESPVFYCDTEFFNGKIEFGSLIIKYNLTE